MKLYEKTTVICAEMKELERLADLSGLSYYIMMEHAGTGAANISLKSYIEKKGKLPSTAVVFAGKGNNGGDGLVMARVFLERGVKTLLVLVDGKPVTKDAISNYKLIEDSIRTVRASEVTGLVNPEETLIVDAVYGTGFQGKLRQNGREAVKTINTLKKKGSFVSSVDIPSGLAGDMTEPDPDYINNSVKADITVTFHAKKPVHDVPGIEKHAGKMIVCDIGILQTLQNQEEEIL